MAKATNDGAAQGQSPALLDYLNKAVAREHELEGALAAHLVVATKPSYQRRIEEYLRSTAARAEQLTGLLDDGGAEAPAPARSRSRKGVEQATRALGERAVALAEGGLAPDQERDGAARMLENAGEQQRSAGELSSAYGVVTALASAARARKTAKLAKQCRSEHEAMVSYLEDLIPKLAKSLVKAEGALESAREAEEENAVDDATAAGDGSPTQRHTTSKKANPASRARTAKAKTGSRPRAARSSSSRARRTS